MANLLYSWNFYSKIKRGSLWYLIAISIASGLVIWGFLSKQYGMSFVIMLLAGLVLYIENNSNDTVKVQITDEGIKIDNNFYPFSSISKFGIIYEGDNPILLRLVTKKKIGIGVIDLNIDKNIVGDIKNILSNFIEEDNKTELNFGEKLVKFLKL